MRLWIETSGVNSAGAAVRAKVSEVKVNVDRQVASRATRALNELRNAELEVLKGGRGGRRYRKYPYKSMYTASAPGEPPARRSGNLRLHWNGTVEAGGGMVTITLESQEFYATYLEHGTRKMAARPFLDRIKEKAEPAVVQIYSAPYG